MSEVFQLVPASDKTLWVLGGIAVLLIGLLCLFGCLAYSSRHTRFEISPEGLTISGGLHGRVTGVTDQTLTVEIADKVRVKINRANVSALTQSVTPPPAPASKKEKSGSAKSK